MYCSKCGSLMDENNKCPKCDGIKKTDGEEMNKRTALLIYLENIRDMEIAKRIIEKKKRTELSGLDKEIESMSGKIGEEIYGKATPVEMDRISNSNDNTNALLMGIGIVFIPIVIAFLMIVLDGGINVVTSGVMLVSFFVAIPLAIYVPFNYLDQKKKENIHRHNNTVKNQKEMYEPKIKELKAKKERRQSFWNNEYSNVSNMLKNAYDLNIIPSIYRDLASIHYIYEIMSTSDVSLEFTLRSAQIEAGIKRIESKLDDIISQNEEILFHDRLREAQNKEMINQNERMLNSLGEIESTSQEAAKYARIGSQYGAWNAYFSMANYLQNKE